MSDLYREIILEQLEDPQHTGQLADADATHAESSSSCGDQVTVYLKLSQDKTQITELKWTGTGCAISQASMSLLSEHILHNPQIADVKALTKTNLEQLLGIEKITPGREKCLLLGLKAIHTSLDSVLE